MRKVLFIAIVAAFAFPGAAAAKEISSAKVCGPSACVTLTDKAALMRATQSSASSFSAIPSPAPYYKVTFFVREPGQGVVGHWDAWWIRGTAQMAGESEPGTTQWSDIDAEFATMLRRATARLTPFAKPRITGVIVDGAPVRGAGSYWPLLTARWRPTSETASDLRQVDVTSNAPNPWTDRVDLFYSAPENILVRAGDRMRVPDRIAANIEARRALTAAVHHRERSWAWFVGGAALLASAAAVGRRLRKQQAAG